MANRIIFPATVTSQTDRKGRILTLKHFESNLLCHWLFCNHSLSDFYTKSKQIFQCNISLFFCVTLYNCSFGIVHQFSNQTVVLCIQMTYIYIYFNFVHTIYVKADFKEFLSIDCNALRYFCKSLYTLSFVNVLPFSK